MCKVLCVIQARAGSSRLPKKVLMDLCGKSVLEHVVERLQNSKEIDEIVIATTNEDKDVCIKEAAEKLKIRCFRGDENNVLSRYYLAAKEFKGDIIIRITSDCPLIDPNLVDQVVKAFKSNRYDYVSPRSKDGLIRGLDVEVFSMKALEKAYKECADEMGLEHVTWFMYNNPDKFNLLDYPVPDKFRHPEIRLCVDEIKDYEKILHIYNKFYDGKIIDIERVIEYLLNNPEINNINYDVVQKHV
ncbi:cytidylyltransferase domain-containing protein [Clostridium septicum]|uniref:Acylneuraminate cytidylyltransferase n=1 Tax=Clostridium septicum TaxID=1504 RepID=A0A9N7PLM1_CLOSE|nr:glycosyltransferase family protein [Clostridium septicum]AYE34876.1 acylneuraminate cytidylyltransferase [Clostridium septicum]MDU1314690.1 glycosyltransferase family protein [Clostridium septicum]QAS60271.1 glycosyltransferase [Clostridium septicum]UEC20474.1 glycosyltransferase family protein [Clostridium septicum]USS01470.1 glycosyltransferase family protein [Clostridium septicum]